MVSNRPFILHSVFLVMRVFVGTKVKIICKYQGHIFYKMATTWALEFTNTEFIFCAKKNL